MERTTRSLSTRIVRVSSGEHDPLTRIKYPPVTEEEETPLPISGGIDHCEPNTRSELTSMKTLRDYNISDT